MNKENRTVALILTIIMITLEVFIAVFDSLGQPWYAYAGKMLFLFILIPVFNTSFIQMIGRSQALYGLYGERGIVRVVLIGLFNLGIMAIPVILSFYVFQKDNYLVVFWILITIICINVGIYDRGFRKAFARALYIELQKI